MSILIPRKKAVEPVKDGKGKAVSIPVIDFPREGERITSSHYAVRIGAAAREEVEISIDGGSWHKCRPSVGYYWFDWVRPAKGNHALAVRAKSAGGQVQKSQPRSCQVS